MDGAGAKGLLDKSLTWKAFRGIVHRAYYNDEKDLRRAGAAAGHMWRFIREMSVGDLVVVPHGQQFYVAKVAGEASYSEDKVPDDSAYRRDAEWLDDKKPLLRSLAKSALISRMKTYGTCAYATDLLDDIKECLELAETGQERT